MMANQITQTNEKYYRLVSLVYNALLPALRDVLHNISGDPSYTGLPMNEADCYKELDTTHRNIICGLLKKKLLSKDQLNLLLPPNQLTSTKTFDVTLMVCLIRNVLHLPYVSNKWEYNTLNHADSSIAANVIRARQIRNFLSHNGPSAVDQPTFTRLWMEGDRVIRELKYNIDLNVLLAAPLDPSTIFHSAELLRLDKEVVFNSAELLRVDKKVVFHSAELLRLDKDVAAANTKADAALVLSKQTDVIAEQAKKIAGKSEDIANDALMKSNAGYMIAGEYLIIRV